MIFFVLVCVCQILLQVACSFHCPITNHKILYASKQPFIALIDSVGQAFRMGLMGSLVFFSHSLWCLFWGNCQLGEGDCLITWGGIIHRRLHSHSWEWFWILTKTSLDCWLVQLHMISPRGPFTWLLQAFFYSIIEHYFHCDLLAKNQL